MPFIGVDLFINFDDERAAAVLEVLAGLSTRTQVLLFTHHAHVAAVAHEALRPAKVSVCCPIGRLPFNWRQRTPPLGLGGGRSAGHEGVDGCQDLIELRELHALGGQPL